jgi:protein PhnA
LIRTSVYGAARLDQDGLIMNDAMHCPKCNSEHAYQDRGLWVCPECAHEWSGEAGGADAEAAHDASVRDSNGNVLADGDSVIVIKDLKVKGSSSVVKGGTKVRNIRLTEASDGHNIACKIDGIGAMNLKSEFVKKA